MAYKLPALTSLRFFAAFMIVISHAGGLFGLHGIVDNFTLAHGVSFFFVLSGFILTYNYAGENREVNWSAYFLHRFARLWPLHIAATVLWFAMFAHPLDATMAQPLAYEALIANIFMVQSWIPIRHFFFSYNAASWSIATEAMFYLLFPLLFVSRSGWPWKGFIFSLFSLFLFGALGSYVRVPIDSESPVVSLIGLMYINPMSRLFEFALGCMTCHLFWQRRSERENHSLGKEMFAVAVFIFSCWLWKQPSISAFANEYLGTVATVYLQNAGSAIPAALLILIYAKSTGPIAKSLSSPGLLFLGEISYSLYLVHLTIYRWFEQRTAYFSESLAMLPIYLAICFSVAIALHLWIEVPLRRAIIIYKWPTLATKRSKILSWPLRPA